VEHSRKKVPQLKKRGEGRRPRITHGEARKLIEAIDCSSLAGMQSRALASLLFFNHLRLGDALGLRPADLIWKGSRPYLLVSRQRWSGQREEQFALTCFPEALTALAGYIEKAKLDSDPNSPIFRTIEQGTGEPTSRPLSARAASRYLNEIARQIGIEREISPHEFRAAGASLLKDQMDSL
jgi:integrase